jgi:drug/metabolite transporter (DMT)-like permease
MGKKDRFQKKLPIWGVHALMLFASVIVSSSFTVGAAITHKMEPSVLLLLRYIIAAAVFAPVVFMRNPFVFPSLRGIFGYGLISFSTVSFFWCMFESLRFTTAINTSIIFALVPGISGVYSAIFLRERLGRYRILALFCGMAGAVWVIFRGDLHRLLNMEINYGDILFLAGCFLMAAYTPLVKKLHRDESMLVMTFWVLTTGVFWLFLLSLAGFREVQWGAVEFQVWAWIIYLAVFSTTITFYLTHMATLYLGPTRVMAYSYLYPVFVLLIDWSLGHGLPSATIVPGIVIVSLATIVLQRGADTVQGS